MSDLTAFQKARLESNSAKQWFDGDISEDQAKSDSRLSGEMIDYWYGWHYHRQERVSHGFG